MSSPVVSLRGLRWARPSADRNSAKTEVLAGVDLALGQGELVALEGPSGGGKTVLGTSLLRLRPPPAAGAIFWGERDVTSLSQRNLSPLRPKYQGMLQHTGALLPSFMTLRQGLEETARCVVGLADVQVAIMSVATQLELTHLLDRLPRFLSGGEQRRASLARLLLTQPEFAFIDEPDAGLDPPSQLDILRRIRALADREGTAILLVTHNEGLARLFADRRVRLKDGVLDAV